MTLKTCVAIAACVLAGGAQAASIVSDTNSLANGPGATLITFNDFDGLLTAGPLDLLPTPGAVVFTSAPFSVVGQYAQDLDQNGLWGARGTPASGLIQTPTGSGNFLSSSFVATRGELGFTFATPVQAVGAFFNQFQTAAGSNALTLLVYDASGNTLESFSFSVDTSALGYNEGKFLGFQRASADIYGFGIADGTFVLDDLTLAPVPEPESYALLIGGLGIVGWVARRRTRGGAAPG